MTLRMLAAIFALGVFPASAHPTCARTLVELKAMLLAEQQLGFSWRETGMDDGKPLLLTILEHDGAIVMRFVKSGEGLWAEGACVICRRGADLEARFSTDRVTLGPAAGWGARFAFSRDSRLSLVRSGTALRISTTGWSGEFSSHPAQ